MNMMYFGCNCCGMLLNLFVLLAVVWKVGEEGSWTEKVEGGGGSTAVHMHMFNFMLLFLTAMCNFLELFGGSNCSASPV